MPTCILARTFKGKDFPDIENLLNWHGKALGGKTDEIVAHLEGLIKNPGADKLPIQVNFGRRDSYDRNSISIIINTENIIE